MDNFYSGTKTQYCSSSYQNNNHSQSEHKQYGSIQSTSHSKNFGKNLHFSQSITPNQSIIESLNRFSPMSH